MPRGTPKWVQDKIPQHLGKICQSAVRKHYMKIYYEKLDEDTLSLKRNPEDS